MLLLLHVGIRGLTSTPEQLCYGLGSVNWTAIVARDPEMDCCSGPLTEDNVIRSVF